MLNVSQNKLFLIAGAFVVVVIILIMIVFLSRGFNPGGEGGPLQNIQFWGVFDDSNDFRSTINAFEQRNPRLRISYRQFNFEDYERELLEAFASGKGPDIFMIHNTWLPKHQEKIGVLPQYPKGQSEPLFTIRDFRDQFVEVTERDLIIKEEIYALPLYVDTLALYYNKDIFNAVGVARPPATWEEFNEVVERVTTMGENDAIIRAGAAIGTAKNINRSTDILSLLMMQSGVSMSDSETGHVNFSRLVNGRDVAQVALEYYTDFANPDKRVYTWNNSLFYSIDAFQQGSAAMMFNYAYQIPVLRSKASRLNFGVAAMPQLNLGAPLNYANYWAAAVSKFSAAQLGSWKFLVYLTSLEGAVSYLNNTKHPTARRDLIDQQKEDAEIGAFTKQALTARSWYQADNLAIEKIMAEMIENVNFKRQSMAEALSVAQNQINVLVQKKR